jgi:hypothetical protein
MTILYIKGEYMKKYFLYIIFVFVCFYIYPQSYNDGNGTILERKTLNGKNYIVTKHETENNSIGWETFNAYENLGETNGKIIFVLSDGMVVSTLAIAYAEERENNFELWIKIKNDHGIIGWIKTDGYYNYYHDNNWIILERLEISGKNLTVRKLEQGLEATTRLNVRDKPSLIGKVLFQLNPWEYVDTLAIIEEQEIIDNIKDHWVKIKDNSGKIGWIFGGYTTVERGGPKYNSPENRIGITLSPP